MTVGDGAVETRGVSINVLDASLEAYVTAALWVSSVMPLTVVVVAPATTTVGSKVGKAGVGNEPVNTFPCLPSLST